MAKPIDIDITQILPQIKINKQKEHNYKCSSFYEERPTVYEEIMLNHPPGTLIADVDF